MTLRWTQRAEMWEGHPGAAGSLLQLHLWTHLQLSPLWSKCSWKGSCLKVTHSCVPSKVHAAWHTAGICWNKISWHGRMETCIQVSLEGQSGGAWRRTLEAWGPRHCPLPLRAQCQPASFSLNGFWGPWAAGQARLGIEDVSVEKLVGCLVMQILIQWIRGKERKRWKFSTCPMRAQDRE